MARFLVTQTANQFMRNLENFIECRFVVHKVKPLDGSVKSFVNMANQNMLEPPECVRGMKHLDRDLFAKSIKVPCLLIDEKNFCQLSKMLNKYMLKMINFKAVQSCNVAKHKKVMINPVEISTWTDFNDDLLEYFKKLDIKKEHFDHELIELRYENWNADVILKAVLPQDKEPLTSYSVIGHIIHVNLRDHLLEFKDVIGEVLLDKVKNAKTVVNKTNKIDNTYRNFSMDVLCGEKNMITEVKENHCRYEFDFSLVYWNPRLSTEHERIVNLLMENDTLIDVFAGVGPFSIPAAKKKCKVFANDLNPESYKWLNHNVALNKVKPGYITTYNKDGVEFIQSDVKRVLVDVWKHNDRGAGAIHVTMNLPALALDFLKSFNGLFSKEDVSVLDSEPSSKQMPFIHVYFFVQGQEPEKTAFDLFKEATGLELVRESLSVHFVRNVSTSKDMMRVSFKAPKYFLCDWEVGPSLEPPVKKVCLDVC